MQKSVPWLCLLVPTWAKPLRYLQETGGDVVEWVKTGNLCVSGHSLLNETPAVKLCNCGGHLDCQGTSNFQLLELHVGDLNDTDRQMAVGDDMWPSRRFYMNQEVSEFDPEDPTSPVYTYTLISNGIGVGRRFSGAYAGLTTYVGESGTASLQFQDFISSSPQTAFQTTEVSRLDTCEMPIETGDDVRRLQGDGDGDGDSEAGNITTVAPDVMVLPSKILCGDNTQISPGRVKMSLYGYTWGKNWESDVAGQDLVFFRWRLCFESRSWYINQVLNGEGILGTGERVHVIDMQQEDGRPLVYWFPRFYTSGDHLDCTFAQDLLYNLPKWECPNTQTIGAVHVTASPAGAACAQDGLIVNIGFLLDQLQKKDRWFLYTMEVNTSSTVTFSSISSAPQSQASWGMAALVPFFLWIRSSL